MQNPWRAALIGAAAGALVTIPGLGSGTLWDNSETAYGEVAREILLTHDWVVMHFNGAPWFVQPPLYFWIAAVCAKMFGIGTFALRLPSALATIAMGGMTGYAVTRQAGFRAGSYAAVILSTCLMQAIVGRLAIMDALLDLAIALTVFWWFRAIQTGRDRYFMYGWVAAAFGFLAKGPVAPIVALIVILPYFAWESHASRAHWPSWRAWLGGVLIFAVIAAPWLGALAARTGFASLAQLIGHYTFGRYTGTIENQSGPFWYYVPVVVLGFFPWIAFLPSAVAFAAGAVRVQPIDEGQRNAQQMMRLAIVWSVVPLLFFSCARTKLPNYIALEFPALAVLAALYIDDALELARTHALRFSAAAVPVTMLLLGVAIEIFSRENRLTGDLRGAATDAIYVAAAIAAGSVGAFCLLLSRRSRTAAPYALAASMLVAVTLISVVALPQAEVFKPVPHLASIIERERQAGDAIAIGEIAGGNALVFYTSPPVYTLRAPYSRTGVLCTAPRAWLVARDDADPPAFGRRRRLIAGWGKAVLYLYDGAQCGRSQHSAMTARTQRDAREI